jgi:hypothetical protein
MRKLIVPDERFERSMISCWGSPDAYRRAASGYSAEDLVSLGFVNSPQHLALIESTPKLESVDRE